MTICEYSEDMIIGIFNEDMKAMPKPIRQFCRYGKKYFLNEDVSYWLYPSCRYVNGEPALEVEPVNGMDKPLVIKLADLHLTDSEMGKLFKYIMFSDNVSVW